MVMMSPQIATTKPAPADRRTSRTGSTCPSGRAQQRRVGAEAVLRLGDADRHVAEPRALPGLQLLRDCRAAGRCRRRGRSRGRWCGSSPPAACRRDRAGGTARVPASTCSATARARSTAPAAPSRPVRAQIGSRAQPRQRRLHAVDLGVGVGGEAVQRDQHRQAEFPHVLDMAGEVGDTAAAPPRHPRGRGRSWPRRHASSAPARWRPPPRRTARCPATRHLMSRNFSPPRSAPKPASVTTTSASLQAEPGRLQRVAAMRDVGERAAMHQRRRAFQRLHQVGLQRVAQQRRHGAVAP